MIVERIIWAIVFYADSTLPKNTTGLTLNSWLFYKDFWALEILATHWAIQSKNNVLL